MLVFVLNIGASWIKNMTKKNDKNKENRKGFSRKNFWEVSKNKDRKNEVFSFAESYKDFISKSKTEEECAQFGKNLLKSKGFKLLDLFSDEKVHENFYLNFERRVLVAGKLLGKNNILETGINFIVSHIDSPRIDLKPVTILDKSDLLIFKTHYYGGIKKYQWVTVPLAMHGTFFKQNGEEVNICIGEDEEDPNFVITDLLPHLGEEQMKKVASKVIEAEELNVLVYSTTDLKDENKNDSSTKKEKTMKDLLLCDLNKLYGIEEEDFVSSDIKFVPAGKARDLGFDKSMILGYGHDDRSSAFCALMSLLDSKKVSKPSIVIWIDKEEIGSEGNSSAQGNILRFLVSRILKSQGIEPNELNISRTFAKSFAISADVDAVSDPTFKSVDDELNTAKINCGVILVKYTGHGGKYSANEASGEFVARLRKVLNDSEVNWQPGLLGQVDKGGGGTIAKFLARHLINVVDMGPGLLSMHAPFEVISKADLFSAYEGYKAFFENF